MLEKPKSGLTHTHTRARARTLTHTHTHAHTRTHFHLYRLTGPFGTQGHFTMGYPWGVATDPPQVFPWQPFSHGCTV